MQKAQLLAATAPSSHDSYQAIADGFCGLS